MTIIGALRWLLVCWVADCLFFAEACSKPNRLPPCFQDTGSANTRQEHVPITYPVDGSSILKTMFLDHKPSAKDDQTAVLGRL
jgi:hypothetical protein